jgi:DNA-binding NarL/FixJ family response regulator
MDKQKAEKLFSTYIQQQEIVVADSCSASRNRLQKILISYGARADHIYTCRNYEEAENAIVQYKPKLVITDYMLGKKSGFDLLRSHKEENEQTKDSLFFLMTADGSQSLVARAAEEEIDSFILKPYTGHSLKDIISKTAINKIHPSEYVLKVDEGKGLLFDKKFDQANECFKEAMKLSSSPTLACYYSGLAKSLMADYELAEEYYGEGLAYNKIHYKCLTGLFNLLFERGKYDEAYKIVRKIARYFPANPDRLGSVLRLAILTNHVDDIEEYYQTFEQIDERPESLIENMTAGLIICGKDHLIKKRIGKGVELLKKSAVISAGNKKFLKFIIEYLVFFGQKNDAHDIYNRFHQEDKQSEEYSISTFLINAENLPPSAIIPKCIQYVREGHKSPAIHYLLIQSLYIQGRKEDAEQYINQFKKTWPEKKYFMDQFSSNDQHKDKKVDENG